MRYSGKTKIEVCSRLSNNWADLADYLEIPADDRSKFAQGREPQGIWEWLECREKLNELADALTFIRRDDLVDLLEPESDLSTTSHPAWEGSPYPGLLSFKPTDAPIFFGRDKEITALTARLNKPANRFLAVIGASGSGKSSLVAAGLIPRLKESNSGVSWLSTRLSPGELGDDPFMALAVGLKPLLQESGYDARNIYDKLRATGNISHLVDSILAKQQAGTELLVLVDQFEELFTQVAAERRKAFTILLAKMAETQGLRTVLTMRADFYHHCLDYPTLEKLLQTEAGTFPLATPDQWALMDIIMGPAAVAGLSFEADLPVRILRDTGSEPGSLALMAFALAELYKVCTDGKTLTHEAYDTFGGVQGAIAIRAEAAYRELDDNARGAFADVFKELVEVDSERGVPTRKRAPETCFNSPMAVQFIEKFASPEIRLLVKDDPKKQQAVVEVAHEALLTHWPRLKDWIDERFDDFRLRRQLQHAVMDWQAHESAEAYLWSDERVIEARGMLERIGYQPSDIERQFLGPIDPARMLEEIDDAAPSHERRALIGIRLAQIGDPRPGVGLQADGLPDIVWCEVPGGIINLEDDAGKFQVEPFYIAKYPITWVQYRAFLNDPEGYANSEWWSGLISQHQEPGRQVQRYDNHPAVNVSWLDALAFCRWLSNRLDYQVRFPTEWEWQQAATGGNQSNNFPWGSEWDAKRANTYESELNRTTAVGMYPTGVSPVKAWDMSGNVWEWCRNEFDDPVRIDPGGDARRVVRGGSWNDSRDGARAACRGRDHPALRVNFLGFRLACSSPIYQNTDH